MMQLNDKQIKRLVWWLTTAISCLLLFVCLPFYKGLVGSGWAITGIILLIMFAFSVSLVLVIFLMSYVVALFLIDCLRLNQQILLRNKMTGVLNTTLISIVIISPLINLKKSPIIGDFFKAFIFWVILPMTVILLSRFLLLKTKKHPILLGLASLIVFNVFGIMYLSIPGMVGGEGGALVFFILFESIVICVISVIVNLVEKNKMKINSGRISK